MIRSVRNDLPPCFQPVYSGSFRYFNSVQSAVFPVAFGSDTNMVVSAPTGAGKTGVMELTILRLMMRHMDSEGAFNLQAGAVKAVYLAPTRALVQERTTDWQQRFGGALGLTCRELTGDSEDLADLDAADIICITPEKFDALTRRHKDQGGMRFFGEIGLVLIDEVHLLGENRGAALEAGCISRIRAVAQAHGMQHLSIAKARFEAVSATIPNINDIAAWLRVPLSGLHVFGQEHRPCKLHTIVRGYNMPSKADFLFERRLNGHLFGIVREFSQGKPSLIFCSSRKGTAETALHLLKDTQQNRGFISSRQQMQCLTAAAAKISDKQLQQVLVAGIGIHNAALDQADRLTVEQLFKDGHLPVLCSTSTLALGVNLPAHLVVVKSTRRWSAEDTEVAGYKEYDTATCLQMIGRAGRPQFDTEGVAVIMTDVKTVQRYQARSAGAEPVESQLQDMLVEYLNAEISLQTVKDITQAVQWLKTTFLAVRAGKNPALYGIKSGESLETQLKKRLTTAVSELAKHGLVQQDEDGFALAPQVPGQLMAQTYTRFDTMALFVTAPQHLEMYDVLMLLARSKELSHVHLRWGERKVLNTVNHRKHDNEIRFHVPEPARPDKPRARITSGPEKIIILINEALSDKPSGQLDHSMRTETDQILHVGQRITLCMARYFAHMKRFKETGNALLLHKSLRQRLWSGSALYCRQLPGIGKLLAERLSAAGVGGLHQLAALDARRIEALTQRNYPFGNQVKADLDKIMPPAVELSITETGRRKGTVDIEICIRRTDEEAGAAAAPQKSFYRLVAGTPHDNVLLLHETLVLEQFPSPLTFRSTVQKPQGGTSLVVTASLIHERLLGLDTSIVTTFDQDGVSKHNHGTLNTAGAPEAQQGAATATTRSTRTHTAARKPRQLKMREALGGAKPAATPPLIDLSPLSDPESEPPPAAASELRYPLSGATNQAERRTAQPAATPPPHQHVSTFDLLSAGVGDAAAHDGGGSAAGQHGSGRAAHLEPRDPAITDEQARPPAIFRNSAPSEGPFSRRNISQLPERLRRSAPAMHDQDADEDTGVQPDFRRFHCGAAPLPPRTQLPGTSPAGVQPLSTAPTQRPVLTPKGARKADRDTDRGGAGGLLDIVRSKARKLSPSGAASFAGTALNSGAAAAEPRKQLNTGQALPGMSQRMVASQLVTPSLHPRRQPLLVSSSPSRPPAKGRAHAPAASRSASPDPLHERETASRPFVFRAAVPAVRGERSSKPVLGANGAGTIADCQAVGASSWQLLQDSGSQPRMNCRSKKALFNAGTIGEVWMPSMSQSQDAAASNAAEQLEPVSIAEPVQLGTTDVLPCQQQHQKQQQGPSLFRSQQAAAVPVDSASEQACESGQHASVPANDIASVFDFL